MLDALPWLLVCVALVLLAGRSAPRDWLVIVLAVLTLVAVFAPAVLR